MSITISIKHSIEDGEIDIATFLQRDPLSNRYKATFNIEVSISEEDANVLGAEDLIELMCDQLSIKTKELIYFLSTKAV